MLSSIVTTSGLNLETLAICSALSIFLGLIVAFVHTKVSRYTKNFAVTLATLPILVQVVMMMVNGNLGTGVAIVGAFSLVRFRSMPGTSREIISVFFAMTIGLATGTGYIGFAILITLLIAVLTLAFHGLKLFNPGQTQQTLRIMVLEDVDYEAVLSPVFEKHKVKASIEQVRTKNMGSLFEITYDIQLPKDLTPKRLIDDLRICNGNLAIILTKYGMEGGL